MVLPQGDLFDTESLQAGVDGLLQVGIGAVGIPAPSLGAHVTALGGQQNLVAHAELVEQGGDESFVLALRVRALLLAGAVGVGGVEAG